MRARPTSISTIILVFWMLTVASASSVNIRPGDTVDVEVLNYKELSAQAKVTAEGSLALPLLGSVDLQGLSTRQAASKISDRLRRYIQGPSVQVTVTGQGDSIFVVGSFTGTLAYQAGETLQSALADLQTPTIRQGSSLRATVSDFNHSGSDLRRVKIRRSGTTLGVYDSLLLRASGDPGPVLLPGDIIALRAKPVQVEIRGEVPDPGLHYLDVNDSLREAIIDAGGALPNSSAQLTLVRKSARSVVNDGSATISTLPAENGDIVFVEPAPKINVVGSLEKPQEVVLTGDQSLLSAIYLAGGPLQNSNLRDVQVMHANSDHHYDITGLTHGDTAQNPLLADGDVVFIPQGHKLNSSLLLSGLTAIFSGLSVLRPF